MNQGLTPEKAKEIINKCEKMDSWALYIQSMSTSVKADMAAFLGGVGTTQRKRKNKNIDKEAEIRAKFRRK